MKIILLLLSVAVAFAENVKVAPPPAFGISAYAVNDYSHISNVKAKNLSRSIAHKNKFINKFTDAIGLKYPSVQTKVRHDREDASATSSNFISDNTDKSEFVFFCRSWSATNSCFL